MAASPDHLARFHIPPKSAILEQECRGRERWTFYAGQCYKPSGGGRGCVLLGANKNEK